MPFNKTRRPVRSRGQTLSLVLGVALAALGWVNAPARAEQTPVTLRLWNIPPKGSTNPVSVARRRVFEAFCRQYPQINVRALVPLKIEGPASEGNEFLAVAGGVAPDVFDLYGRKIGDYHSQGFLEPLDDYLADYAKQAGHAYRGISAPSPVWELCQIEGRIYCVPMLYYSMTLMCRRDMFARVGLPLRTPEDWDEFYRFARRLTWLPSKQPEARPGDPAVYGMHIQTSGHAGWHLLQYVWSAGGEVVRSYYPKDDQLIEVPAPPVDYRRWHVAISDGETYYPQLEKLRRSLRAKGIDPDYGMTDVKWRLVTDEPGGVAALEFYRRMLHSRWLRCENDHDDREFDLTPAMLKSGRAVCPVCGTEVDLTAPQGRKRIYYGVAQAGQAPQPGETVIYAMRIGTLQEVERADLTNTVSLPFPSATRDLPPAAFIAGWYLGINATQKDPRVRQAAWRYIKFITGPEAQKIRVDTYIENGLEAFIRPASLKALGYDVELARIPKERLALWGHLARYPKVEPYCKGFQHVMTRQLTMPIEAIAGDTPDDAGHFTRDPQQLMTDICRDANLMKLDKPPAEVLAKRERIGWVLMAIVIAVLALAVWATIGFAVKIAKKAADIEGFGVQGTTIRRTLVIAIFLAPAVGSVLLWGYYPLIRGTVMAFQDFKIIGGSSWVGLENFVLTASSPEFWRYLLQTFEYLALSLAMGFFAPIILAILLTEVPKGKIVYRTIYYLPAVTTGLVTLFMWKRLLYDPSASGLINQIILSFNDQPPGVMLLLKTVIAAILVLAVVGLVRMCFSRGASLFGRILPLLIAVPLTAYVIVRGMHIVSGDGLVTWLTAPWAFSPQRFLQDPHLAMFWVVVPTVWAGMGPGCLIYLAALKGVPEEQYEAADLDGAGIWAKCTNVVFPNLSALIMINLVGAVVGAMHASGNIFVMTGGGPEDVTMTVGLSVWFNAYMFLNFGLATSQAWVLGAMLIGFTLYQLRLLNKMQFRTAAAKEGAA